MKSYVGCNILYLENFKIVNRVLGVFPIIENNSGDHIETKFQEIMNKFSIEKTKTTAVGAEGGANIKKAVTDLFGESKYIWCFAHRLSHLVPKSIEKLQEIKEVISKVNTFVRFVRKSVVASNKLRRLQKADNKKEGKMFMYINDFKTRWNSTYQMLERYLMLKRYSSIQRYSAILLKCSRKEVPNILYPKKKFLEDVVK